MRDETDENPSPPDDPALTAELLLVLRLVLADGDADPRTMSVLHRVAGADCRLAAEGIEEVLGEIEALLSSAGRTEVAAVMRELPLERRRTIALRIAAIAATDDSLRPSQERLARRLGAVLGLDGGV